MVRFRRFLVVFVSVAENQAVVAQTERIAINSDWVQVDIGIATFSLISGAAIVVPNWQFYVNTNLKKKELAKRTK